MVYGSSRYCLIVSDFSLPCFKSFMRIFIFLRDSNLCCIIYIIRFRWSYVQVSINIYSNSWKSYFIFYCCWRNDNTLSSICKYKFYNFSEMPPLSSYVPFISSGSPPSFSENSDNDWLIFPLAVD